jgi:anti-sigma B factor antagonist
MLEIRFRKIKFIAVFVLSGSVDIDSSSLIERVGWCIENGYRDVLLDFEDVNTVDYAGLSAIAIAYKNVINHRGKMKFVNVPLHIRKIFNLVCLDRVFEVFDDEKLALKSFEEDQVISEIQQRHLRRRFRRLPLDINIDFRSKNEEKYHKGKLLNLSGVGMLVFVDKTYPLGEILDIRLSLSPSPGLFEAKVKVVWLVQKEIQPQIYPGMGLEFYHIDSKTQSKVVEFVERNLPLNSSSDNT